MLHRYRRFWILLASALLLAPMTFGVLTPEGDATIKLELRERAPFPEWPGDGAEWRALPKKLDAYLRDNFGLRQPITRAHAVIAHQWLHSGNAWVQIGLDNWFFYRLDDLLPQSAGLLVREARVNETADVIASINAALAARGIRFVVASPPNSATVYSDMLPEWARNRGQPTEYDLMLHALEARGLEVVDLRPPLLAARSEGMAYFPHDTHWTPFGALAGFNAMAAAAGHADWRLDPAQALGQPVPVPEGDLTRMLGLAEDTRERVPQLVLSRGQEEVFGPRPLTFQLTSTRNSGPTVMVIGDSFTAAFFGPMTLAHTGRFAWTHHKKCGFDWSWIEKFHPDEVWWMPTERLLLCDVGVRPKGLPAIEIAQPGAAIRSGALSEP